MTDADNDWRQWWLILMMIDDIDDDSDDNNDDNNDDDNDDDNDMILMNMHAISICIYTEYIRLMNNFQTRSSVMMNDKENFENLLELNSRPWVYRIYTLHTALPTIP